MASISLREWGRGAAGQRAMRCFVCHEPTTERCACVCKAPVHKTCLLRSIEACQKTDCTICKQPIQDVAQRPVRVVSRWVCAFAIALVSTIVAASLASLLLLALAVDDRHDEAFFDLLVCCASSVGLAMCASGFLQKLLEDHALTETRDVYQFV